MILAAHRLLVVLQPCATLVDFGGEEMTLVKLKTTAWQILLVIPSFGFEAWTGDETALNGCLDVLVYL